MKSLKIICVLFIAAFSINAQSVRLKIIETSDVHGMVFPYDFLNEKETSHSLSHLSSYLKNEREDSTFTEILLDNGDILQGTPLVYYYNFIDTTSTHAYAEAMNFLQYDAATIGNHDIEAGHAVYDKFRKQINFTWLAANAVRTDNKKPYFQPYQIIEKNGFKIAVIGLITPHIPNWLPENIWKGMYFEDMVESADKWVKAVKKNEKPDLIIGLFHAGFDFTYGNQNEATFKNENASQIVAKKVDGFDIVFVGHDHQGWDTVITNNFGNIVQILGTTSSARNIAVAEVLLNKSNQKTIKEIDGYLHDLSEYEADKEFLKIFQNSYDKTKEFVSRKIGSFTEEISSKEALFGNSAFVDLIPKIQLELSNADISFAAPLSFNTTINKGDIFVKDMFKLYRYENLLYTMEMTGKEIKDYLEFSYSNWFNQMKDENDNLLLYEKDENGNIKFSNRSNSPELKERFYNYDSAGGLIYEVDVTKEAGNRIKIISLTNGAKFELKKKYKVALNSYRGNGGGNHLTKGAKIPQNKLSERVIDSTERDLRYYMMKWIEEKNEITPKASGGWKVVPQDYWFKGMKKDYRFLFGTEN